MVRAVVGSSLGSAVTMLLFFEGPQVFQQGIAVMTDAGTFETLVAAGVIAYIGGFVGNPQRPHGWTAAAVWAGGWAAGFLINWRFAYVNEPIPA